MGIGSGTGLLLGGFLSVRLAARDIRLPLKIGALATAFALPAICGILMAPTANASFYWVLIAWICLSVSNGPVIAAVQSVVLPGMRATSSAITIFFTSVLGFGLGPFLVGIVSDLLTPTYGQEALRYAMLSTVILIPFMVIFLYRATQRLPNDLRAAGVKL